MKPWGYVALLVLLVGAVGGIYAAGHGAGYDSRDKTVAGEIEDALKAKQEQFDQEWQDMLDALEPTIVVEERIVEKIREVEVEVPQVVERIVVERPECRDLGDEYGGLLDQQVAAANSRETPVDPSELDARVP